MNIRKTYLVAFFLLLLTGAPSLSGRAQEKQVVDVTAHEAYALMQENLDNLDFLIIDVRTPEEYQSGHLKGTVNIPLNSGTFKEDLDKLDRGKTILVYCRSGSRSAWAVGMMRTLEFVRIYHMVKGIIEWNEEGLPLEKEKNDAA